MKIRITGKQLPKHQGFIGPSQVMGNPMTFPEIQPFDFQKGMDKITGKFKVNQPGFGYASMGTGSTCRFWASDEIRGCRNAKQLQCK
jgi:hypothetical protein